MDMFGIKFRGGCILTIMAATLLVSFMTVEMSMAAPISACTTISSPGEYVLNSNINNYASGTCIKITSNDVVLDGNGFTIDGIKAGSTYGVYVYNTSFTLSNVTVKNLIATDWDNGIYYRYVNNGKIINDTTLSNINSGIWVRNSDNNLIKTHLLQIPAN